MNFSSIVGTSASEEELALEFYNRTKIPIQSVQLTGTALSQLVNHCSTSMGRLGQIFGLSLDGVLEVTYVLPLPLPDPDSEIDYPNEMRAHLTEIGVDNNVVGFYCVGSQGDFFERKFLRDLYRVQAENSNSVALVYDPLLTQEGELSLKGYRLTDSFFEYLGLKNRTSDFSFDQALETYPVSVKTTGYENCVLGIMRGDSRYKVSAEYLEDNNIIEASLDRLISLSTTLQKEESVKSSYEQKLSEKTRQQNELIEKRKAENVTRKKEGQPPLPETKEILAKEFPQLFKPPTGKPDVFTSLLTRYQMSNVTDLIDSTQ